MGITIIQKSDLDNPKPNPKIALVLAGGAVSGAAFKVGGLLALNSFMVNRKINDFDMYVGISAGSAISVYLANGVPAWEIVKSMEGKKGMLDPIRASDLYHFNFKDFIRQPFHLCRDALTIIPETLFNFAYRNNVFRRQFRELWMQMFREPNYENLERLCKYSFMANGTSPRSALPWHYIPTGIFTTDGFERSMRKNLENNRLSNDFNELRKRTGKELYVIAMHLDTARRAIFGCDHIDTVPISKAIQASIAIPLFYKPVTIDDAEYIDGAVVKTTSIDIAVAKGADLVICYNPFRPFNHETFCKVCEEQDRRLRIAQDGIYAVLNQTMRTMLHTRLKSGLELRRKNPDFKGDIILFEPTEYDDKFFDMNPMGFRERRLAAQRGFDSVRESISEKYSVLKKILNAYGIDTSPSFVRERKDEKITYLQSAYENILI